MKKIIELNVDKSEMNDFNFKLFYRYIKISLDWVTVISMNFLMNNPRSMGYPRSILRYNKDVSFQLMHQNQS